MSKNQEYEPGKEPERVEKQKINLVLNSTGVGDDYPVRLMGVINISSGSFYKGSVYTPGSIPEVAQRMIKNNASFLDIGGRSTAPQADPVTVDEEKERVRSALESLLSSCDTGNTQLSIDTMYREVAQTAFDVMKKHGKERYFMLNEVSCFYADPSLADWICDVDKPITLMASHGKPGDSLGIHQTIEDLTRAIETLLKKGFSAAERVIIDPAIGRWIPEKLPVYDLEILARLEEFRVLSQPVLVGISRKSFIGAILDKKDPEFRYQGTLTATAIAVFNGAHIVRTHDITNETMDTVTLAKEIRNQRG